MQAAESGVYPVQNNVYPTQGGVYRAQNAVHAAQNVVYPAQNDIFRTDSRTLTSPTDPQTPISLPNPNQVTPVHLGPPVPPVPAVAPCGSVVISS